MKEEWKVYIKGVPGKAKEVINTLVALGAKDPFMHDGDNYDPLKYHADDPTSLYFI